MSQILTRTGRLVDPLAMKVEDVDAFDIAHALANKCRFTGHTRSFYSVAQHSVLVSDQLELELEGESVDVQLWGLLHDAGEAYLPDVAAPIKGKLYFIDADDVGSIRTFSDVEESILRVVAELFDLPWPCPESVKRADSGLLLEEMAALMPPVPGVARDASWRALNIAPQLPELAMAHFLGRLGWLHPRRQVREAS